MATFLLILKIIGIVLLCIPAFILLLLLIVLFVPVRYRVAGSYDKEAYLKAKVTYLLHLIGFTATYDVSFKAVLRILFVPIRLLPKKEKKPEKPEKPKDSKPDKKAEDKPESGKSEATGTVDKTEQTEPSVTNTEAGETDSHPEGHKVGKADKEDKSSDKLGTIDKIKAYADLLSAPETVAAWEECKYRLGKLIKVLLPRHIDIRVRYGLDDPFMTSVIMSIYNVFYIYLGGGLTIEPVYYEKTVSVQGKISGRIMTAPVLWQALMVFLNKDCRRFVKRIRKIK